MLLSQINMFFDSFVNSCDVDSVAEDIGMTDVINDMFAENVITEDEAYMILLEKILDERLYTVLFSNVDYIQISDNQYFIKKVVISENDNLILIFY